MLIFLVSLFFFFTLELVCGKYTAWNEEPSFQVKGDWNRISKAFIWCPASSCTGESFSRFWTRWCYDWEGMNNWQLCCLGVTGRGRSVWGGSKTPTNVVRTYGPGFGHVSSMGRVAVTWGGLYLVSAVSHKKQESSMTCFSSSNLEIFWELLLVRWKGIVW